MYYGLWSATVIHLAEYGMYKSVAIQYNHHGVVYQLLRQYRACVVDSVLWYIHRQACHSTITNTLCIHVSTQ